MSGALLLVGHGTRSAEGRAECVELAGRVAALRPALQVATGFLELCDPPVAESIAGLVRDGADEITAVPLTLHTASHTKGDIPAAVVRARHAHPQVTFHYGTALDVHPALLGVAADRLDAAVPEEAHRASTAVVLVGRGSTDPDANAHHHRVARLLWEGRDWPLVEPAFVGLTDPDVTAALERVHRLGARRVAVLSYMLFTGVLERRVRDQAAAYAAAHPGMEVVAAGYLGPDARIASLVLDRFDQARAGAAHVNCDVCMYRVALPGFEHRVGQPQTLHHHPGDAGTWAEGDGGHEHAHAGGDGPARPGGGHGGREHAHGGGGDGGHEHAPAGGDGRARPGGGYGGTHPGRAGDRP